MYGNNWEEVAEAAYSRERCTEPKSCTKCRVAPPLTTFSPSNSTICYTCIARYARERGNPDARVFGAYGIKKFCFMRKEAEDE